MQVNLLNFGAYSAHLLIIISLKKVLIYKKKSALCARKRFCVFDVVVNPFPFEYKSSPGESRRCTKSLHFEDFSSIRRRNFRLLAQVL